MPYNNDMKKILSFTLIAAVLLVLLLAFVACGSAKPTKLTVTKEPDSVKVIQGQEADLSGGLVEVEFDDGLTKEFPMSEMTVKGLNSDVLGTQTVALSYTAGGKTVSAVIDLTVVAPKVTALILTTDDVKKEYVEGNMFDKTGLVVTAKYQTGDTAEVANYEISPSTALTTEITKVRISYRGASADIPVTVAAHAPTSIRFTSLPNKTTYFVGEAFSATGIAALVEHNDGTTETLGQSALRFYHYNTLNDYVKPTDVNDTRVKVVARTKYGYITTSFDLTVNAIVPTRLTVTMNGTLNFVEGDTFDFDVAEGVASVRVDYSDGSHRILACGRDYFVADTSESLTIEQTSVTIWMSGYPSVTASVPITVTEAQVTGIMRLLMPSKTSYSVGEAVDLTGLTIRIDLSNGGYRTLDYSDGCGITTTTPIIVADQTEITVSYQGFTDSFGITLNAS